MEKLRENFESLRKSLVFNIIKDIPIPYCREQEIGLRTEVTSGNESLNGLGGGPVVKFKDVIRTSSRNWKRRDVREPIVGTTVIQKL